MHHLLDLLLDGLSLRLYQTEYKTHCRLEAEKRCCHLDLNCHQKLQRTKNLFTINKHLFTIKLCQNFINLCCFAACKASIDQNMFSDTLRLETALQTIIDTVLITIFIAVNTIIHFILSSHLMQLGLPGSLMISTQHYIIKVYRHGDRLFVVQICILTHS